MAFITKGRAGNVDVDSLDLYKISDMDSQGNPSENNPHYFGYVNTVCGWYIARIGNETARYIKGSGNYDISWANRESLEYRSFQEVF